MGPPVLIDWIFVFMPPVILAYFAWELWRENKRRLAEEAADEQEFESQVFEQFAPRDEAKSDEGMERK